MFKAGRLFIMVAIAATTITSVHAVEISDIAISKNGKYATTVTLTGDDIINCVDQYYPESYYLVLSIIDGATRLAAGQYSVNRGSIGSLVLVRKGDRKLDIVVKGTDKITYLLINNDNYVEAIIDEQNDDAIKPWSIAQLCDLDINKEKYSAADTIIATWAYTGPKDSVRYRYRIDGPKQWPGDSSLANGTWSVWKPAKQGEFVQPTFAVKGKYTFSIQRGSGDTVLAEAKKKFKIQ